MTVGKKIGMAAFLISEVLIILVVIAFVYNKEWGLLPGIIAAQTGIFTVTWGAVATKQFKKGIKND